MGAVSPHSDKSILVDGYRKLSDLATGNMSVSLPSAIYEAVLPTNPMTHRRPAHTELITNFIRQAHVTDPTFVRMAAIAVAELTYSYPGSANGNIDVSVAFSSYGDVIAMLCI